MTTAFTFIVILGLWWVMLSLLDSADRARNWPTQVAYAMLALGCFGFGCLLAVTLS